MKQTDFFPEQIHIYPVPPPRAKEKVKEHLIRDKLFLKTITTEKKLIIETGRLR